MLMSVEKFAQQLDVKPGTVRLWKSNGKLARMGVRCVKLGRMVRLDATRFFKDIETGKLS